MNGLLDQCRWPDLPPQSAAALREAAAFILDRYQAGGLLVSGSIQRGHPDLSSDLDIYVLHLEPWRQRLQRFFNGVPSEIFINPEPQILRYLLEEHQDGRPITAHMWATGFVVLDCDPAVERLRQLAREYLSKPVEYSEAQLTVIRYFAAIQYEDATDMTNLEPAGAQMILSEAVYKMLHYRFYQGGQFLPREKDLFLALTQLDSPLAELARTFYGPADPGERLALAGEIARRTIAASGFFEWESQPEMV